MQYEKSCGAIIYRKFHGNTELLLIKHANGGHWSFPKGHVENNETEEETAKREIFEEIGICTEQIFALKNTAFVPNTCFAKTHRQYWDKDAYIIPEYSFAFECSVEITLSHEHKEYVWLTYQQAREVLHWDSNKIALYELDCRLRDVDARE